MKYVKCKLREEIFSLEDLEYFKGKKRDLKRFRSGESIVLPFGVYHEALKKAKLTALSVFKREEESAPKRKKSKKSVDEISVEEVEQVEIVEESKPEE